MHDLSSFLVILTPLFQWPHQHVERVVVLGGGGHDIGHGVAIASRALTLDSPHLSWSSAYSAPQTPQFGGSLWMLV